MRRTLTSLICCCFISLPVQATTILLLGDSLSASYGMQASEGWAALTQQRLDSANTGVKLLNFSASGETTAGGKARLARLLDKNQVDVLWIELGGNDGLRGYPIKTIRNNLHKMITLAQDKNIKVILTQVEIPPNLGKRYLTMFRAIFPTLATETNSTLMPFFIQDVALDKNLMQADGIHPNQQAQPIIRDFVLEFLVGYLGSD
ncbi:MAG: arylesterase [Gammaproteobacteria bacterium]|nr:arylesterase [Gammaproteobacteria bacterium]